MAITTTIMTRGLPRRLAGPEAWKKIAAVIIESCIVPFTDFGPTQRLWGRIQPGGFPSPLSQPAGFSARVAAQVGHSLCRAVLEESRTLFRSHVQAGPTA